jgi:hypothetical protein
MSSMGDWARRLAHPNKCTLSILGIASFVPLAGWRKTANLAPYVFQEILLTCVGIHWRGGLR